MELYQELPIWMRGELGVMAIKRYRTFPKALGLKPHDMVKCFFISKTFDRWSTAPSRETQMVYSTIAAKCKHRIVWSLFITKTILSLQNYDFDGSRFEQKSVVKVSVS